MRRFRTGPYHPSYTRRTQPIFTTQPTTQRSRAQKLPTQYRDPFRDLVRNAQGPVQVEPTYTPNIMAAAGKRGCSHPLFTESVSTTPGRGEARGATTSTATLPCSQGRRSTQVRCLQVLPPKTLPPDDDTRLPETPDANHGHQTHRMFERGEPRSTLWTVGQILQDTLGCLPLRRRQSRLFFWARPFDQRCDRGMGRGLPIPARTCK